MNHTCLKKTSLLFIAIVAAGMASFAQAAPLTSEPADAESVATDAPDTIFSNLDRDPTSRYNSNQYNALTLAGSRATADTETWQAVAFIPRTEVQAKILLAAIGYDSGAKLINLGIYSDDDLNVGTLLPGAQGSTTQIPDLG